MNELLTLAIVPTGLWLILIFLRVRGVALIWSVLVGKLFSDELSGNLSSAAGNFININDIRQTQLFLLFLPIILTVILTRSKTPKSKTLVNAFVLLFASASIVLLALPYTDLTSTLSETGRNIIDSYQGYIVCAAAGAALVFTWLPDLKRDKHKK